MQQETQLHSCFSRLDQNLCTCMHLYDWIMKDEQQGRFPFHEYENFCTVSAGSSSVSRTTHCVKGSHLWDVSKPHFPWNCLFATYRDHCNLTVAPISLFLRIINDFKSQQHGHPLLRRLQLSLRIRNFMRCATAAPQSLSAVVAPAMLNIQSTQNSCPAFLHFLTLCGFWCLFLQEDAKKEKLPVPVAPAPIKYDGDDVIYMGYDKGWVCCS